MVDYSKWDKFNYDDEDDEDDEEVDIRPTVKKIGGDKGGKVHIGPSGYSVKNEHDEEVDNFTAEHPEVPPSKEDRRVVSLNINSENGSIGCYRGTHYYWSQDRYEVILTLFLDWIDGMKKKDIAVSYFSGTKELKIAARRDSSLTFKGNFQFGVEVTGDPENPYDEVFEWSVVPDMQHPADDHHLCTAVQLVLKKASPLPNAIFWWKNVFVGEPHIDVTKIKGRATTASAAQDEFQQAQKIFFERLQQQQQQQRAVGDEVDRRIEVDIPDDDDEDDDAHDS